MDETYFIDLIHSKLNLFLHKLQYIDIHKLQYNYRFMYVYLFDYFFQGNTSQCLRMNQRQMVKRTRIKTSIKVLYYVGNIDILYFSTMNNSYIITCFVIICINVSTAIFFTTTYY